MPERNFTIPSLLGVIGLVAIIWSCEETVDSERTFAERPRGGPSVLITEVYLPIDTTDTIFPKAWVELWNRSRFYVSTESLKVIVNNDTIALPDTVISPTGFLLVETAITDNAMALETANDFVSLFLIGEHGKALDQIQVPGRTSDQSFGRTVEDEAREIYFPTSQISPGEPNQYTGRWRKLAHRATFDPRDSSPNACLSYDGYFWIFAGYRPEEPEWNSSSDVWKSKDGVTWELVNGEPPFSPYSAFVNFDGYMWAFETSAFRSADGIKWEKVADLPLDVQGRVCEFNGRLYWIKGSSVYSSSNGFDWIRVLENAPWQSRNWPGLVVLNGKMWLIGGGAGYGSDAMKYFNDVWSSTDGVNWELVTDNAAWPGRYWFNAVGFDDRLWILGGWTQMDTPTFGNQHDVWWSTDGVNWKQQVNSFIWEERHASLVWTTDDAMYLAAGYGGGGVSTLYNDVWILDRRKN